MAKGKAAAKTVKGSNSRKIEEFLNKGRSTAGRKRLTAETHELSSDESDELDSENESQSEDNDNNSEQSSDSEFNLASLDNSMITSSLLSAKKKKNNNNKKKSTKDKSSGKKTNKRRKVGDSSNAEVTMEISSQLLEQVTDMDDENSLYDQILNVDVEVDELAKKWTEDYKKDKIPALQDLINFVIRSSGCKMAVTRDAFADEDLPVDALQELQEQLSKLPHHEYPIISRAKIHKPLKRNLLLFFQELISICKSDLLYDGSLMETLQSWLATMSSSVYRPFRHTATLIALKITSSLCVVANETKASLKTTTRQRNTGSKRGGKTRENISTTRQRQLTKRLKDLDEYINDFFGSIFTHRVRDIESVIRVECIKELNLWVQLYPDHFLENQYIRYLGWFLNDPNPTVRSEALKSTSKLSKLEDIIEKMGSFIERFAPRIEEMVLYDVDVTVRVNAIQLCSVLYNHDQELLSNKTRQALTNLVMSNNPRIRKSVAPFVKSIIDKNILNPSMEQVESALASLTVESSSSNNNNNDANTKDIRRNWVVFKSIAGFLSERVKTTSDTNNIDDDDNDNGMNLNQSGLFLFDQRNIQVIENTCESLWGYIKELHEYEAMLDYLSKDHSVTQHQSNDYNNNSTAIAECYRLAPNEETILVYVFINCLKLMIKRGIERPGEKKKDEVQLEETRNSISRHLAPLLPSLLLKYSDDVNKMRRLIYIPQLMNLNVYLELRMKDEYQELLQALCKYYSSITIPEVLQTCILSLQHVIKASFMSDINDPIMKDLQERIVTQLRDACHGKDLYTARFSKDDSHSITTTMTRLDYLIGILDITDTMEQKDDSKSDVNDILNELIERAAFGYDGESQIGQSAISISFRYLVWQASRLVDDDLLAADKDVVAKVEKRREWAIEKILEFISDTDVTPLPEVRRLAFGVVIDLYSLFSNNVFLKPDLVTLHLKCSENIQNQLIEYIKSEIKAWNEADDDDINNDHDRKQSYMDLLSSFGRGIITRVIDIKYSKLLLVEYGLKDPELDLPIKALVEEFEIDVVRSSSMTEQICKLYMDSLKESFEKHADINYRSMDKSLKLARLLCQSLKEANEKDEVRKMQEDIVCEHIHIDGIVYIMSNLHQITSETNDDDDRLERMTVALKFFKILSLFAKNLYRARDVGKIHKQLENSLQQYSLHPTEEAKEWESYFSYMSAIDDVLKKKGLRYDYNANN
ncbi:unnamed protein product [Cunninghamella blakesleeana]